MYCISGPAVKSAEVYNNVIYDESVALVNIRGAITLGLSDRGGLFCVNNESIISSERVRPRLCQDKEGAKYEICRVFQYRLTAVDWCTVL